jgi:hypothetical protein
MLTVSTLLAGSYPACGQAAAPAGYLWKARYLLNFPRFVEWPEVTWTSGQSSFLICVFGEYPFGSSLAELSRGATVHEKRVEIRWIHKAEEARACQMVFVTQSDRKKYAQVLGVVRGLAVLTVGETPDFLAAGGVVNFTRQEAPIQFDVNLGGANRAHLKISSRMLALARHVVDEAGAGKSYDVDK